MQLSSFQLSHLEQHSKMKMEEDDELVDTWSTSPTDAPESPSDSKALKEAANCSPSTGSTGSNASHTSNMLLSMMQSMPFLVFGPQIAAAAAVAAAAATTSSMTPPSTTAPFSSTHPRMAPTATATDFSIDSILNSRSQASSQLLTPWTPSYPVQLDSYPTLSHYSLHSPVYHTQESSRAYAWLNNHLTAHSPPSAFTSLEECTKEEMAKSHPSKNRESTPFKVELTQKSSPKSTGSSSSTSTSTTAATTPTKRKSLNRGPRIPFTSTQVAELEGKFNATQYLSSMEVSQLAKRLNLTDNRIRIWFQNRRAREKREHRTPLPTIAPTVGCSEQRSKVMNLGKPCKGEQAQLATVDGKGAFTNGSDQEMDIPLSMDDDAEEEDSQL